MLGLRSNFREEEEWRSLIEIEMEVKIMEGVRRGSGGVGEN